MNIFFSKETTLGIVSITIVTLSNVMNYFNNNIYIKNFLVFLAVASGIFSIFLLVRQEMNNNKVQSKLDKIVENIFNEFDFNLEREVNELIKKYFKNKFDFDIKALVRPKDMNIFIFFDKNDTEFILPVKIEDIKKIYTKVYYLEEDENKVLKDVIEDGILKSGIDGDIINNLISSIFILAGFNNVEGWNLKITWGENNFIKSLEINIINRIIRITLNKDEFEKRKFTYLFDVLNKELSPLIHDVTAHAT